MALAGKKKSALRARGGDMRAGAGWRDMKGAHCVRPENYDWALALVGVAAAAEWSTLGAAMLSAA